MQTLDWSDILELGHERVDAEHRLLMDLAERIRRTTVDGEIHKVQPLYRAFHRQLVAHCAYEEGLLRSLPHAIYGTEVGAPSRRGPPRPPPTTD